ncbi:hypothetical protein EMCRGX_G031746 [Ephydatia muelleri]
MAEVGYPQRAAEQEEGQASGAGEQPNSIWDKLSDSKPVEREMACRTLAQIDFDEKHIRRLIAFGRAKQLLCLLSDPVLSVREATATALRKMCSYNPKVNFCDHLVSEGIMAALGGHLRECLQELSKESQAGADMATSEAQARSLVCHVSLSEQTQSAVDAFNEASLLAVVACLLQPQHLPLSLVTAAAQCLHIVTEDNTVATQSLCATPESLALLEGILVQPIGEGFESPGGLWSLKTSVAGVLFNLLPLLQEPVYTTTMRAILSVMAAALDVGVDGLLLQLATQPRPPAEQGQHTEQTPVVENGSGECDVGSDDVRHGTGDGDMPGVQDEEPSTTVTLNMPPVLTKKFADVEAMLSSQQLALELVINISSMEDDDQWDDAEEEEEEECEVDMEVDDKTPPHTSTPPAEVISSLAEFGLFAKVWKICCSVNQHTYKLCETVENGEEIAKIMNTLQGRSLCAFQNLLTVLPHDALGGKNHLVGVWRSLLELMQSGGQFLHPDALAEVMGALIENCSAHGSLGIMAEDLHYLCQLGLTSLNPRVRSSVMRLLGTVGKMAVLDPRPLGLLNVIGATLRDCVSQDPQLWVVSQALDSVFDVFGEDNCPVTLYQTLGLPSVLKSAASTFKSRMVSERDDVKPHLRVVKTAHSNLRAFMQYMTGRAAS